MARQLRRGVALARPATLVVGRRDVHEHLPVGAGGRGHMARAIGPAAAILATLRLACGSHQLSHHRQHRHPDVPGNARALDDLVEPRVLAGDQPEPCHVKVGQRPRVLECRASGLTANRRGVGPIAVDRRVQVDQVDRGVVARTAPSVAVRPSAASHTSVVATARASTVRGEPAEDLS